MRKPIVRKIAKNKYEITVIGNRDPRGADNEIYVEVDKNDNLIITIPKTRRCYAFDKVEITEGYTKVIAN